MTEDETERKLTPAQVACNRVIGVFNEEMLKLEGDSILSFKFLFCKKAAIIAEDLNI